MKRKWLRYNLISIVILNVLNWLDFYLTMMSVGKYGIVIEANPLMRIALQYWPVFMLSKLSGSMLLILAYFSLKSLRPIERKIAFVTFLLLIVLYLYLVLVSFV